MATVTKAYDIKELIEIVKEEGGPEAEKFLKANINAVKKWLTLSAPISANKVDDIAIPLSISTLSPLLDKVIDHVDGKIG